MSEKKSLLPLKNIAAALLFSVILGPVGVLYSSVLGGVVMIILGFVAFSAKFPVPIIMVWLGSCIWSVAAANKYNKKLLNEMRL
jgi:hypothetical protein